VSTEAKKRGCDVRNLDIIGDPTYKEDILKWDYKEALKDWKPDIIWASPDCRSWCVAQHGIHRKPDLIPLTDVARKGNEMILKTLEIIEHCQARHWFIENPRGHLRHFEPMKKLPYRNTVYYGNWDYPACKPTDIWSNIQLAAEKPPSKSLFDYVPNSKSHNRYLDNNKSKRNLIPQKLIEHILDQVGL
jgi:site-specific DNA-cytosine methylase